MTIEEYFGDWTKVLDVKEADSILRKISYSRETVCPRIKDVFRAFKLCSLASLRMVILGQDPYNDFIEGKPRATGIAFANRKNTSNYSPSLEIIKESVIDFTVPHPPINFDPSLEKWEEQGVLMLNSALTCLKGKPGSHMLIWRPFIKTLLINLSKHTTGIVYLLMGSQAESFKDCIDSRFNHIITTKHPAWYARNQTRMPPYIWIEVNKILKSLNGTEIKWYTELLTD